MGFLPLFRSSITELGRLFFSQLAFPVLLLGDRGCLRLTSPMGQGDYWAKKTLCNVKAAPCFAKIQKRSTLNTGRLKEFMTLNLRHGHNFTHKSQTVTAQFWPWKITHLSSNQLMIQADGPILLDWSTPRISKLQGAIRQFPIPSAERFYCNCFHYSWSVYCIKFIWEHQQISKKPAPRND